MRIIYMGTPDFAVLPLERLIADGHEIVGVFTQADKPKNRGMLLCAPPVKVCALRYGLKVFQPASFKTDETYELMKSLKADIAVITAYGKILPKRILDLPKHGCINVHASILPFYRGASPIQQVIIRGESESGVTIMQMNEGLDTGDIILLKKTPITDDETAETLHDKLALIGAEAASEAVLLIASGNATRTAQPTQCPFYAPLIKKEDGFISFSKTAREIDCLARAMQPWPGTFGELGSLKLKIYDVRAIKSDMRGECGQIVSCDANGLRVYCSDGIVTIKELQAAGKKRIPCEDYFRGNKNSLSAHFK